MSDQKQNDQVKEAVNSAFTCWIWRLEDEHASPADIEGIRRAKARVDEFFVQAEADRRELAVLREQLKGCQAQITGLSNRSWAPF